MHHDVTATAKGGRRLYVANIFKPSRTLSQANLGASSSRWCVLCHSALGSCCFLHLCFVGAAAFFPWVVLFPSGWWYSPPSLFWVVLLVLLSPCGAAFLPPPFSSGAAVPLLLLRGAALLLPSLGRCGGSSSLLVGGVALHPPSLERCCLPDINQDLNILLFLILPNYKNPNSKLNINKKSFVD